MVRDGLLSFDFKVVKHKLQLGYISNYGAVIVREALTMYYANIFCS